MLAEVALPLAVQKNFSYKVPDHLLNQIQPGHLVKVPFRQWFLSGVVVDLHENSSVLTEIHLLKEIHSISSDRVVPPQLMRLMVWLSKEYACSLGEALSLVPLQFKSVKKENEKSDFSTLWKLPYDLSLEQTQAIKTITNAVEKKCMGRFLLYGVTSSGKTEVYLHAIAQVLRLGKQALFLVPEISICPPFLEALKERFGCCVGVWHSHVSVKDKNSLVEGIFSGEITVVVGARSALFLPLKNLGIIILDEEHDFSYKQQEKPRYHARAAALKLMELHTGVVVMGSATPSLETFYRASIGEFQMLELPKRVSSLSLPKVRIVDKKQAPSSDNSLSIELKERLSKILWKREQSILALNRRGFFTYLICSQCGFVWKCPHCELALVLHKKESGEVYLECHYCFEKEKVSIECRSCGSFRLFTGGCGTQKVVQELKKEFPFARVLRLDKDTARKKGVSAQTYESFKEESADILVGTQMVTQGFHFPRVTLVGIVDADTGLYHPDFRAAEKSYQWLSQAAGRSGRSEMGGEVVIQSSLPDHYVLKAVERQDYRSFYDQEIQFRKELGYPPFSRLVLLRVQGAKKQELVVPESERLAEWLKNSVKSEIEILGPGPCPREFLRARRRWQILIKCKEDGSLKRVTQSALEFTPRSGIQVVIDVDVYDTL